MKKLHTALTFALGAAMVSMTAHAQTAQNQTTQPSAAGTQPPVSAAQPPGTAVNPTPPGDTRPRMGQGDNETALSDDDRQFLEDAIQGSYAEIEGSQLALEKAEDAEVRAFAEQMIKDHSKMAEEGAKLATKKGLTPPDGPSAMQTTEVAGLKALSGGAFDAMYINRIGVAAHEATVEMFEEASQNAQDPDVKAMATEALPKLREHLKMAQQINEKQEKQ